tara:strand:- start:2234 stop:2467 length:234 start_codon:yes stop_codon:yes gene_type:complete
MICGLSCFFGGKLNGCLGFVCLGFVCKLNDKLNDCLGFVFEQDFLKIKKLTLRTILKKEKEHDKTRSLNSLIMKQWR